LVSNEPDSTDHAAVADILAALSDGRIEDVLSGIDRLAQRLGGAPLVFYLAGLASLRLNESGKAVEALLTAHQAEPDLREYSGALAIVMSRVGRLVDSLYYQKLSIAATRETGIPGLLPDWIGNFTEAFRNIPEAPLLRSAEAAFARGDYAAATALFFQECEIDRASAPAWAGLARACLGDRQPFKAVAAAETLVALAPDAADNVALLGTCLAQAGRFDAAMTTHRRAEALRPGDANLAWHGVVSAALRPGVPVHDLSEIMVRWGRNFIPARVPHELDARPDLNGRRIRLGIVSAHWAEGEGLDMLVPVIELLDRRRIELFCYADGRLDAALAVRMRQRANIWRDLRETDDATARFMIGNDDLDVLIALDGPTRRTRPELFATRLAALVLGAYGIAEAAGDLGFDGVIGDERAYPATVPGTIIRVPGGLAALPSGTVPPSNSARETRPLAFGTLATSWQIGTETVACWAAILAAVPEATLILDPRRFDRLDVFHGLVERFGSLLPADRVLTSNSGGVLADYLPSIDVLLDPLDNPHPDEALVALTHGVPVMTCRSAMPRAALLASWLETAGLGDLVAADRPGYIAAAAALADRGRRQALAARVSTAVAAELTDGAMRQAARLGSAILATLLGRTA
jgi:tetratricopeptide (TPR) repeat protein